MLHELESISPIDGRYRNKTSELAPYYSELALIKYRLIVELKYLLFLKEIELPQLTAMPVEPIIDLLQHVESLSVEDGQKIKNIEATTNHDVKAVEYFIKEHLAIAGMSDYIEFVHFGLTSQDINNTAVPLALKESLAQVMYPMMLQLIEQLVQFGKSHQGIPMLARTHGQPATPTDLGKEIHVFSTRLQDQLPPMYAIPFRAKFGGATGNFNAHFVAYPEIDWHAAGKDFVEHHLGLSRSYPTTQIEPYDMLAAHCHAFMRFNTICLDLCRDIWTYISMDYFTQRIVKDEVGSSAMPHKVNPIDFENAEGNLGVANAIFGHLSAKLPISRLQRDLTDSTVLRNLGVPFGHSLIAYKSILKGLSKLKVNQAKIGQELDGQWAVLSEAIQTILRREGFIKPYELLKGLSRGNHGIDKSDIYEFIESLEVGDEVKQELHVLTPANYVGK
jgi:adenylosuccinate lyase